VASERAEARGRLRPAAELSERDLRILETAAVAFRERGFHGVGMDELGTRAGLSGPTLYRHFSGKDEILATLLNTAMDELMAATVPQGPDPGRELDRALRHHVRFALERRDLVVVHQREVGNLVAPWDSAFAQRMGLYTRAWERLVAAALPRLHEERVAALTQACLGTVFSVSVWPTRALRVGDAEAVAALVLALLHDGLSGS
jgi:AcrR family transcriptional regulator